MDDATRLRIEAIENAVFAFGAALCAEPSLRINYMELKEFYAMARVANGDAK